jgi:hypothetical protein
LISYKQLSKLHKEGQQQQGTITCDMEDEEVVMIARAHSSELIFFLFPRAGFHKNGIPWEHIGSILAACPVCLLSI